MRRVVTLACLCLSLTGVGWADSIWSWDGICTGSKLRWKGIHPSLSGTIPKEDGEIVITVWTGQPVKRPGTVHWVFEASGSGCPNLGIQGTLDIPKGGTRASQSLLAFPSGCRQDLPFTLDFDSMGKKIFRRDPLNPVVGVNMRWTPSPGPLGPRCGNRVTEPPEVCDNETIRCDLLYPYDAVLIDEPVAYCLPTCDGWDAKHCRPFPPQ
jgi:hypothetical protein